MQGLAGSTPAAGSPPHTNPTRKRGLSTIPPKIVHRLRPKEPQECTSGRQAVVTGESSPFSPSPDGAALVIYSVGFRPDRQTSALRARRLVAFLIPHFRSALAAAETVRPRPVAKKMPSATWDRFPPFSPFSPFSNVFFFCPLPSNSKP